VLGPAVFACITLASCALRPPNRRLPDASTESSSDAKAWMVCIGVVAAFTAIAFLTLPYVPKHP
jgi:hypothetical protein